MGTFGARTLTKSHHKLSLPSLQSNMCAHTGTFERGNLKEWKSTKNIFPVYQFVVLSAVFRPLLGLLSLVSSVLLLQGQMQLCYFQALVTKLALSAWASLDPSSSSCCFEADLIYAQRGCCRSQIREIRALQECIWLPLPCSSRGTHSHKMLRRLKEIGQNSRRRSLYCLVLAG